MKRKRRRSQGRETRTMPVVCGLPPSFCDGCRQKARLITQKGRRRGRNTFSRLRRRYCGGLAAVSADIQGCTKSQSYPKTSLFPRRVEKAEKVAKSAGQQNIHHFSSQKGAAGRLQKPMGVGEKLFSGSGAGKWLMFPSMHREYHTGCVRYRFYFPWRQSYDRR